MTVVASGPPNLWTILIAVAATANLSLGTEAYAADTEGIPIVPWPTPATSRLLFIESTYGGHADVTRSRDEAERELMTVIKQTIDNGGKELRSIR